MPPTSGAKADFRVILSSHSYPSRIRVTSHLQTMNTSSSFAGLSGSNLVATAHRSHRWKTPRSHRLPVWSHELYPAHQRVVSRPSSRLEAAPHVFARRYCTGLVSRNVPPFPLDECVCGATAPPACSRAIDTPMHVDGLSAASGHSAGGTKFLAIVDRNGTEGRRDQMAAHQPANSLQRNPIKSQRNTALVIQYSCLQWLLSSYAALLSKQAAADSYQPYR